MTERTSIPAESLISAILNRDVDLDAQTPLSEIEGWDSLKGVRLMLKVEEELGRELTENELESIHSVGDVSRLLAAAR